MHLSILLPTHRNDLQACARIVQACSWAGPELEVIVRDNSGNADKRNLLRQIRNEHCRIEIVDECGAIENHTEIVKLAQGEYIFVVADDDFAFDRAMTSLPGLVAQHAKDSSVVGLTGMYAVEHSHGSSIVGYDHLDAGDVTARVGGYLAYQGVNVLVYSPVRKDLFQRVFEFVGGMPFPFSFHDQISCLLYLLNGKFARVRRLMYLYDVGEWEKPESAQKRDRDFLNAAGLDPAVNKLHWFICAFEGAVLIRNSDMFPDYPLAQRQAMADRWFATMFHRFANSRRDAFGSRFSRDADLLCDKWRSSAGRLSFHDMLADISTFMALSSSDKAETFSRYWDATLARGASAGQPKRAAGQ
jgi:hypothetical protein